MNIKENSRAFNDIVEQRDIKVDNKEDAMGIL